MRYLAEKSSNISTLIENQFPQFVQENNQKFLKFLTSYYESLETKYQPLDIASNLIEYYNIGYYTPNQLVKSTVLTSNLLKSNSTITVSSTFGFPKEDGYIRINGEIIFYKRTTETEFLECFRGTSALVLENVPKSEVILQTSTAIEHKNNSIVENIAYFYAFEFFNRIKSEIAPLITENIVEDLNFTQFLKNIKSFYSSKGSLNSHRILFKILFNDKKFNIALKPRGSGAKLKINNFNRIILSEPKPQIVSGGTGYDSRKDPITNKLVNSPIINIIGSGTGQVNSEGLRPNKTAIIEVTDIDSSGSIIDIEVIDSGEGYIGPIESKIRPRSFKQDQRVFNVSGTGFGKVDYWDGFRNELVLYDVIGFFKPDDEIIGIGDENPRAFIARVFVGTTSIRAGIEVVPEVQNIEFPRDYTFKTSNSIFSNKQLIKCKILRGNFYNDKIPSTITLIQDADSLFGVNGTDIRVDNIIPIRDNTFEIDISSSNNIGDLYLQPTSVITKVDNTENNFVITVDDASRFPITNGILCIDGILIEYRERTFNQFFGCIYYVPGSTVNIQEGSKVISWGRKKYNVIWQENQNIQIGEFRYFQDNLYKATTYGLTGSIAPIHTSGIERDGSFESGDIDPVNWEYVGSNLHKHVLYAKQFDLQLEDIEFELIALPGDFVIVDGGSLHTKQIYEFANLESPNTQMFNFTTSEISNRLSVLLSTNFNRENNTVTDERLPSYKSLSGFNTLHDYEDYIYVPTSTIPPWWNEIINLSNTIGALDERKVAFTNQKLVGRWKKSSLVFDTKVVADFKPTKKSIGLNIDGIQINSYKGNTINFGRINRFTIADGGNYKIPLKNDGSFDFTKYPPFILTSTTGQITEVTNQNNLIRISSGISSINFNKLAELWNSNDFLSGYTTKPVIEVINNNPRKTRLIDKNSFNIITNQITINYSANEVGKFQDGDIVTYARAIDSSNKSIQTPIPSLVIGNRYYIRQVSNNVYTLHATETDYILNKNILSLDYISGINDFKIRLSTDQLNPIDFNAAELDLSYNQFTGTIDNIIIKNSGKGYINAPTIKIVGGGKLDDPELIIPFILNGHEIIEMRGELISSTNFYKQNKFEIDTFNINTSYVLPPRVRVDSGSESEAVVYVAGGSIASVVLIKKGKNYYTKPTVKITGNGTGAVVEAVISDGQIQRFDIINSGTGYTLSPTIEIIPNGSGGIVSASLNEWTFNLVHRFSLLDRLDNFGGYVYDESDTYPSEYNVQNLMHIHPDYDLPPSVDNKQYLLLNSSDKLLAKYTIEQRNLNSSYQEGDDNDQEDDDDGIICLPGGTIVDNQGAEIESPTQKIYRYQTQEEIDEVLNLDVHSPILGIINDGVPLYGKKCYSVKFDSNSQLTDIRSRYKLKYSTTSTQNSVSYIVNGTTYYVRRIGGPSVLEYPIGSFIEDYEFVEGSVNDLDIHNGRFCVTPEFPTGRYCYFSTKLSFDHVTNEIIRQSNVNFGGFPYAVANVYAGVPDNYLNKGCRTNDKIPKFFDRIFEKEIPAFKTNEITFDGLSSNKNYPSESSNYDKTVCKGQFLSSGSVDSIIIENSGTGYRIGDRLISTPGSLSLGSGLSGFVSKVIGKNIIDVNYVKNDNEVEIFTSEFHGLSVGDYVYFDYDPADNFITINLFDSGFTAISDELNEVANISLDTKNVSKFIDKKIYTLNLNGKFTYRFNIPNLEYLISLDIEKSNEIFVGTRTTASTLLIDANEMPNICYLHIGEYIYQIFKISEYFGEHRVISVNNDTNSFKFKVNEDASNYQTSYLKYDAKSRGTSGGVSEITISNGGSGYTSLPGVEIESLNNTGSGAIIQSNSTSIGKIKTVKYISAGGGFTSNINVNHYLNLPSTAKIINNFEIYEVEVVSGGIEYKDVLKILVNGRDDLCEFEIISQLGVITSVNVVDGGNNFKETPTLSVISSTGVGAVLKAKIRRKQLFNGQILTTSPNSIIFPVTCKLKVINFDTLSSTIEFDQLIGQFKDGDMLIDANGRNYGKLISVRRPKIYAKVNSHITLDSENRAISGNTSEFLQKITDSKVYQDWSYIISSSRDTIEWRDEVVKNTHPSGHNLSGRKVIEKRKFFFDNPEDIFKTSVIFTANLSNQILLKLKTTPCSEQTISLAKNNHNFSVGDYIFGVVSESIGEIIEITEWSIKVKNRNNSKFIIGEVALKISPTFAFSILLKSICDFKYEKETRTNKFLGFFEGIFQEPEVSYVVSPPNLEYEILDDVFIPKFVLSSGETITVYKIENDYDYLDSVSLNERNNRFPVTMGGETYPINNSNIGNFIFSIGGSVQNPSTFTVCENTVFLNERVNYNNTRVFGIHQENLKLLEFNGDSEGDTFTINYVPQSECNLLIFYVGVSQNSLLSNWSLNGNIITFSESLEKDKIFGWYLDENVECYTITDEELNDFKIIATRGCTTKNFTHFIESNTVKSPNSIYEINKKVLDGTVEVTPDTVFGFDTKFTYTSPKFSSSYVEIMDPLPFNGSLKSFTLKIFNHTNYIPKNGKKSILVYIDDQVLDPELYQISGSTITFINTYNSTAKCTIIDFVSNFASNYSDQNGEILDRLNVSQNGIRKTFNMSDNGVPQYVRNPGDIFILKNGSLKRPELRSYKNKLDSETESLTNNKITFVTAPQQNDNLKLVYFNRQLLPEPTKNVVLDDFRCFDGIRVEFPITLDGILFTPINELHFFVVRNGVYQKPLIDYTISGSFITFNTAPEKGDNIFVYYSYDLLNQNIIIDNFRYFDGVNTKFALTNNFISSTVESEYNIQVYRNGVYQHPILDYTIGGNTTGRFIDFKTAPIPQDNIFIVNCNSDLVNISNKFTQSDVNELQYLPGSEVIDTNTFLIYINGLLQVGDSWLFDDIDNKLIFASNISLDNDKITILAFESKKIIFDEFIIEDGIDTYTIEEDGTEIANDLILNSSDIVVSIDGVVQEPETSYRIDGSSITLLNFNQNVGSIVYIHQIASGDSELIDYLNDDFSKSTYKLANNFASFNPPSNSDIFVLRNGIVQNPVEDFITGNGFITFTDNISDIDDVFIMYVHGTEELLIESASGSVIVLEDAPDILDQNNIVLFVNGTPKFIQKDYTISGSTITLNEDYTIDPETTPFVIKYPPITYIDDLDDCPNGTRTRFKLLYNNQNLIISDILTDADILVSVNGIVQYPGVQYTISENRGLIDFLVAPQETDEIFFVRMSGNQVINLTPTGAARTYTLSSAVVSEQENLVIFSNNQWKFNETSEYSYLNTNTIRLQSANTSQYVFGIKFTGVFKLLDQTNTPYNSLNTKFNIFINEENFVPQGTTDNEGLPDETSLFVTKNGKVLEPKVDYQLSGDIRSQIIFAVAPVFTDIISVRTFGSFKKLNSITSSLSGRIFDLKSGSADYYPNYDISRPREHENQILVIRDGIVQSPLYDYYIHNNKLIFNQNIPQSTSKIVILDFRGTSFDVLVNNRFYQTKVGDEITIYGENSPRKITEVLSPTVLKTELYTGISPQNFSATTQQESGRITNITVTNGGMHYEHPVVLRSVGSGNGAKATAQVNYFDGGVIQQDGINLQYPGYNVYVPHEVVSTSYAFTYRKQQLSKSQIRKGTKLTNSIGIDNEFIPLNNTTGMESNPPSIEVTSLTGSGASFKIFVSSNKIRKVEVIDSGIGYDDRSIDIQLISDSGTGCVLEPVLDAMGSFTNVIVRNPGVGYDTFKVIIYDINNTNVKSEFIEYTYVTEFGIDGCTRGINAFSHIQNSVVYFDSYL
jgi:hypothetical protein